MSLGRNFKIIFSQLNRNIKAGSRESCGITDRVFHNIKSLGTFNFINGLFSEFSISVGFMNTSLSFSVCKLYSYDILKDFLLLLKEQFFKFHQFVKFEIFGIGSF